MVHAPVRHRYNSKYGSHDGPDLYSGVHVLWRAAHVEAGLPPTHKASAGLAVALAKAVSPATGGARGPEGPPPQLSTQMSSGSRSGNDVRQAVRRARSYFGAARHCPAVSLLAIVLSVAAPTLAQPIDPHTAIDLDGRPVDPLHASPPVRATVLLFMRTDCPIANRFAPTIERLRASYEPRGIRFWLVFVDPSQSGDEIRAHLTAFAQHSGAVRDPHHALVTMTGATRTPEAAVFVHDGPVPRLVYRGRIDNRYVDVSRARPRPTKRDLEEALDDILDGATSGTARNTQPIGCVIADLR
jgi:hypothetical protein